MIYCYRSFPKP